MANVLGVSDVVVVSNMVHKYAGKIGIIVGFVGWLENVCTSYVGFAKVKFTDGNIEAISSLDLKLEYSVLDAKDVEKLQQELFDELIEPAIIANIQNTIEKDDFNEAAHQDFLDRMYESGMMMPIGRE